MHFSFFFALSHFAMMLSAAAAAGVCLHHTVSFWRCGSHGITVAVLQGLRFVTATNAVLLCMCMCAYFCGRAVLKQRGTLPAHTSSEFQKHPRSTAGVQHQQTSQGAHTYEIGTPVFPLFNLRHPQHFKSTTSRRGTLCTYEYVEKIARTYVGFPSY